ncbi:nucleophile aminohydrolase [Podospora australis]|uniref:Nucleophile aminohydrolase n=1 Tax=Podospora australis TaxID=1536484 RepID=A0AAN7AH56_9PEZI|nr:nucleophile aminohydrolase [Podospora australis]
MEYKPQHPLNHTPRFKPRIIIHGGAGNITPAYLTPDLYKEYRSALLTTISKAHNFMLTPTSSSLPSSLQVSTYAVTLLEENRLFNAGKGAVFTRDGINELEASVMVSSPSTTYPKAGVGVAGLRRVRNPILLAKAILERGEDDLLGRKELDVPSAQGHTLLYGEAAEILAQKYGLEMVDPEYFYTQKRWDEHIRALEREKQGVGVASWSSEEYLPQGTVGAVALDEDGVICVATSTGGLTNKLTGRIGDTPSVGAGFWAEEWTEELTKPGSSNDWRTRPGPAVVLTDALKGLVSDCLPTPFTYSPIAPPWKKVFVTRSFAGSGTGNGDSFWRTAALRTVGAIARFQEQSSAEAVRRVAGPGGILQKSAGDRWKKAGEGEGGIIGIEAILIFDEEGNVIETESAILQNFNCNGMFRAWVDENGAVFTRVWREEDEPDSSYNEGQPEDPRIWCGEKSV